ncbi:MAG: zinc ribbon domain-containing protein [Dehalococcoidia bacterium]|nr:zinc ribbon domain-containing protein [Dehalococcoidia bacterium]
MPIYEYECGSCNLRFEKRQGFDEEPACLCPACQGKARRVIHSVPVVFKGSGFYVTDNRRGDNGSKKRAASDGEKAETAAKSEKSDTTAKTEKTEKSEAKSEKKDAVASRASDKS